MRQTSIHNFRQKGEGVERFLKDADDLHLLHLFPQAE
jgi:hypothetical protein